MGRRERGVRGRMGGGGRRRWGLRGYVGKGVWYIQIQFRYIDVRGWCLCSLLRLRRIVFLRL